jgi:GMP synthase-like glutamine amidotransferase
LTSVLVLQHEECEHLGVLSTFLSQHNVVHQYVKLFEQESIPELKDYSGLIILGGPMNVYEEKKYSFLRAENSLINEALSHKKPIIGICLGAQLIAKATGGKVYPGVNKEVGWYTVNLTEEGQKDKVFRCFEGHFTVFQWHGDTFDLPVCAMRLAESDIFHNQAFSIGDIGYAIQFHLEVTSQMISDWFKRYEDELIPLQGYIDPDKILRDSEKHIQALNRRAAILCSNFATLLK